MRLSCNGCRVLRKGCTTDCPIRPSLHWIKSSDSQANATLFLAKFYGRAGLINLLSAGPPQLRPAIFKSLLYEACGRVANPIFGSSGLLTSGSWHLCQAAVEAVLSGAPIAKAPSDVRHVSKRGSSRAFDQLHGVKSLGSRFKRRASAGKPKPRVDPVGAELEGSVSRDSGSGVSECEHSNSVESVEPAPGKNSVEERADDGELELELTLGWGPVNGCGGIDGPDDDTCRD